MKRAETFPLAAILPTTLLLLSLQPASVGQVIPDGTLPQPSLVNHSEQVYEITGGTTRGSNLFHSFEQFSLSAGDTAFFNNSPAIQNILTRVTGRSISNIDGLIRANGSANLFLLNPNGIIFGPNARLDIGGSFIGSTANSLRFADGTEFSAVNPQSSPLLTIRVPTGLQFGRNPGSIQVQGPGNNLRLDQDTLSVIREDRPSGLQVQPQQTLALLGGDIALEGGNLTATNGRIELGSVGSQSAIALQPTATGWTTRYNNANAFRDIRLSQAASVDVSGDRSGYIQVQGRRLTLTDGSTLLANTLDAGRGGTIQVRTTESVVLRGFSRSTASASFPFSSTILTDVSADATGSGGNLSLTTDQLRLFRGASLSASTSGLGSTGNLQVTARQIELVGQANSAPSGLFVSVNNLGTGRPGNLAVSSDRLIVRDGAQINSTTFANGNAGNVEISARTIELSGRGTEFPSALAAASQGSGNGGQLIVNTDQLQVINGAEISTNAFSSGNAGDLTVHAETVELNGRPDFATGLFAQVQPNASGRGGNLHVNAGQLRVLNGASVSASTFGSGRAGNLTVNAGNVELAGFFPLRRSGLFASALIGRGMGGNLNVTSDRLTIRDGATINASNFHSIRQDIPPGQGPAGNINISANFIHLDQEGLITASTVEGGRGNINLRGQSLILSQNSRISANSQGEEPGGNIAIALNFLTAASNSDITANAVNARGGQIQVGTQALFGTAIRDRLTSQSDITASSELGTNFQGTIVLNAPERANIENIVDLPSDTLNASDQITTACEPIEGSFFITGRGGVPEDPTQSLSSSSTWQDLRVTGEVSQTSNQSNSTISNSNLGRIDTSNKSPERAVSTNSQRLIEAQGWIKDAQGQISLITSIPISVARSPQYRITRCHH